MDPSPRPRSIAEARPREGRHPRATPAALAVLVAALSLVGVFFVMLLARLAVIVARLPVLTRTLHRVAAALGIGS